MPLDADAVAELKGQITAARTRALNLGFCLGKKPEGTAFVLHRVKSPEMLMREAKRMDGVEASKSGCGTLTSEGKLLLIDCLAEPPVGSAKKLKTFFKTLGLQYKIKIQLAGTDFENDGEEDEEGGEAQAEEGVAEAPDGSKDWAALAQALDPKVAAFIKADQGDVSRVRAAWAMAREKAAEKDFPGAVKIARRMPELMQATPGEQVGRAPKLDAAQAAKIVADLKALVDPVKVAMVALPDQAEEAKGLMSLVKDGVTDRDYDGARVNLTKLDMIVAAATKVREKSASELKRLGAEVDAAFKAGTGPVDMLRKLWPYVEQLEGEGKAKQALDAMKKVEEVLAKTSAAKTGEAATEVPKDTTAKAACAQMLKDLDARAKLIARAGELFPDRAKVIEELARKARSAAEADDLKTTQAAMGAIGKLLNEAAKAEVALAAAQAGAETARGEATALTAKYEALIGKPLPKTVTDPIAAAGKHLETAGEVDPVKIGQAVALGREKLEEAARIGDRIATDKAGWAPVRQGFAQLLKALLAHAEATSTAAKTLIEAFQALLKEADDAAAAFDFSTMPARQIALQAAHDKALEMADATAKFAVVVADRATRAGAMPDTSPVPMVDTMLKALKKKLADAQKAGSGATPDFIAATKLLDEMAKDLPAVETQLHYQSDYATTLDKTTKAMERQKAKAAKIPDLTALGLEAVSTLLPEAERLIGEADVAKTKDFRKSADLIGRASSIVGESRKVIDAYSKTALAMGKAKKGFDTLKAHKGKDGIKLEVAQIEKVRTASVDLLNANSFAAAAKAVDQVVALCAEATKKAKLYEDYLVELKKSEGLETQGTGGLAADIVREIVSAKEWRVEAKNLAAAGKIAEAMDAAKSADVYFQAAKLINSARTAMKEVTDAGKGVDGGTGAGFDDARDKCADLIQGIEAAPGAGEDVIANPLALAKAAFATASAAATKKPAPDWGKANGDIQTAIAQAKAAFEQQVSYIVVDGHIKRVDAALGQIEDVDGMFTEDIKDLADDLHDVGVDRDDGDFDAAESDLDQIALRVVALKLRTVAYKEFLAFTNSDVKPIKDKLDNAKAIAAMAPNVQNFLDAYKAAKDRAKTVEEREALEDMKKLHKRGLILTKQHDEFVELGTYVGTYLGSAKIARAKAFRARYPQAVDKIDKLEVAMEAAKTGQQFKRAKDLARDLALACQDTYGDGDKAVLFEAEHKKADTALKAAEAETCAPVAPAIERLRAAYANATAEAERRYFTDANKIVESILDEAPKLTKRGEQFKAYDPEAKKAVAALEGLAKLTAKQPAVAVLLKPLDEARAAMDALAKGLDFVKAKTAAEDIVKRAATVEAEAKAQGAAGDLADSLASKPLEAADGFDDDLAAVRKQFAAVDGHVAKEAVKDARASIEALLKSAADLQGGGDTRGARTALNEAAKASAAALVLADTSQAAAASAKAAADRLKPTKAAATEPPALVALISEIDALLIQAAKDAEGPGAAKAVEALAPVDRRIDTAEKHLADQKTYATERDRLAKLVEPVEKHKQRFAIAREMREIYAFLEAAAKAALALDYKAATSALASVDRAIKVAELAADMAANSDVDEKKIDALLKLPGGDKELDRVMQNLDPGAKRKVCKVAMEKRFGFDFKQFKDTEGATDDTDTDKRAVNITRLYDVMSRLPDGHAANNPSLARVEDFGDEKPATGKPSTSSSFNSGDKVVKLRVGRSDVDRTEKLGLPSELAEIDEDSKPVTGGTPPSKFSWTTLHEIGHAVDDRQGYMDKNMGKADHGGWEVYGADIGPVAKLLSDKFKYTQSYIEAYMTGTTVVPPDPDPKHGMDPAKEDDIHTWEMRRIEVEAWCDASRNSAKVYFSASKCAKQTLGDRVYFEAYDGKWLSHLADARKKGVSGYQFRAPGEWFAELYAAYHTGKLNARHPARKWLEKL